jgi:hypothetical protein
VIASKANEKKYSDIFYVENSTTDFDNGFDSSLYSGTSSDFEVFTKLVNGNDKMNLSIQSIPIDYSIVIPIGVIAPENQEIEIKLESKNINENLYLEDREKGIFILMNSSKSFYSFTNDKAVNGSGRFYIHILSELLQTNQFSLPDIKAFVKEEKMYFSNLPKGEVFVEIFDVKGKLILSDDITNKAFVYVANLTKGIYIYKLKTAKGIIKNKIILE